MDPFTYSSDGATLFATARGSGEPLILLHGGMADHGSCLELASLLAPRFRAVTPDLRGSGRSIDPGPLGWDQLADDVAALLDHLGVSSAIVGGTSAGAACAVRFALRHPARTLGLAVIHPAFGGADLGLSQAQVDAMRAMDEAARRAVELGIEALLPLYDGLPEPIRGRAKEMAAGFDPASVAATTRLLRSGAQPFARGADLAAITAPTLVVPGLDPQHPPESRRSTRSTSAAAG
jgi:pimeloyl-ACP methyl ester carboxylesterase